MSKGVVDQEYVDSARKACEVAKARGCKAVNTSIHHNPDGSRTFIWRFEPIEKPGRRKAAPPCPPPSMTHDPDDFEADIRRRIGRGGVPKAKAVQGALDL